jgi:acetoacetate decarboxylase
MSELKSMPVSAPLYSFEPGQPLEYPDAELLMVMYSIDPERAVRLVPAPIQIASKPHAICYVARYPKSFVGPYQEAATLIEVELEAGSTRVPGWFVASNYVDSDAAMAAGREIHGFPRKLATIEAAEKDGRRFGRVLRNGLTLMEIGVAPAKEVEELPGGDVINVLNLKVVPSADLNGVESAAIVSCDIAMPGGGQIRIGSAVIELAESVTDPLHLLRPVNPESQMMGAVIGSDFLMSAGKVIRKID